LGERFAISKKSSATFEPTSLTVFTALYDKSREEVPAPRGAKSYAPKTSGS